MASQQFPPPTGRNASTEPTGVSISALSGAPCDDPLEPPGWPVNDTIGPYHLIRRIGSGGMGQVWLAEQSEPVRRQVAVKLVKAGMDTGEVVARFQSERQALALMDHPSIAKVFEAGSTPQGRPYFVMEYIAGVPITEYCDERKMPVRERLELFIQVCEAVQHAHQKAIIHRDLKPSNILLSEVDGKPVPRIIDFGVAKAISHGLIGDAEFTRTGVIVGTPAYMSPEQARSVGLDVDTRTDVYSLGVVLYELLVGARPFDFHDLAFDEMLKRLREEESPRPSAKLRTQRDQSSVTAQNRGSDPPALMRQLRGDLDAITLKALEKDRSRRYGSPAELAADIGRYLRNEAVLAVPPSALYRTRKFVRRYRGALATAAAFVAVLIGATVFSIRQSMRANSEAAVAEAVNNFLQNDVLAQASVATQSGPNETPDPDLKVRTALDRAAATIKGKFETQPEVEAAIRETIGQAYLDLGLYAEARAQAERAADLYRHAFGKESPKTLSALSGVGWIAWEQGKYAESEALLRPTLEIQRRVLGKDHSDTLSSMNNLANVYLAEGKYVQAEMLHKQTMEIRRRVLGPEHSDTLASMNNLSSVYGAQGKYAQAEILDREVLNIKRRVQGAEHPATLMSMNNLGTDYEREGRYPEAEALLSRALEVGRRVDGPEHPETLRSESNLSMIYYLQGKYEKAEPLAKENLDVTRRVLGPEHPDTMGSMINLADVYAIEGNYAKAEALFSQTLQMWRRVMGPEHPGTLETLSSMASLYQHQRQYALAETYATQALAGRRRAVGLDDPDTMASASDLVLVYVSEGKFKEGEPLAREAVDFYRKKQPEDWQRFRAESLLGASLAGQKKYAEAEPLLLEGYEGMMARKERIAVPDRYHLDRAREWIVQLYQACGKPDKAAAWKRSELFATAKK